MEAGAPNGPVFASVFGSSFQMFPGHPVKQTKESDTVGSITLIFHGKRDVPRSGTEAAYISQNLLF